MRISLNWLKKYVDVNISDEELVRLIGARLVEVEGIIDEMHKYDKIYIAKVEKTTKIPETHLTLCKINVGQLDSLKGEMDEDGLVQVVCGAPNVREGMLAVWIAPGAVVPASAHEDAPFVIGKRKMRGYESCGMLAGADELDFGDDHSGIVEIEPNTARPGDLLSDLFELNDQILEIENKSLTHRPDCFGMVGFAREVAGILGQQFKYDYLGRDSSRSNEEKDDQFNDSIKTQKNVSIGISDEKICPRYTAVALGKHGEFSQKYLSFTDVLISKAGMKPVSPIVDATNYLMLLTGQPMHAFDYDKFITVGKTEKPVINIRLAREGEKLVLLDDKEIELKKDDIVICSGDIPVALAGAMGGKSTMIDENTNKIILESATFSLYNLRKTQMEHGIFTEAITRFTKGLPPFQTLGVAEECTEMLSKGLRVEEVADAYPHPQKNDVVKITTKEINGLLGTVYDEKIIIETLKNVGFGVDVQQDYDGDGDSELKVLVPSWRMDIHIKEDVIEEVGRLLGYENITPVLPAHYTASRNDMFDLKHEARDVMARYGANEVLTYSFVSGKLLAKAGQDFNNSYKIVNSISPELQYIRQSIVPSLLEKAYVNEKLPVEKFAIFEMNEVYHKDLGMDTDRLPVSKLSMGCVIAERKNNETAYYKAKKYVAKLLAEFGIEADYVLLRSKSADSVMFEPKRSAEIIVGDDCIGVVGEFKASVRYEFKLAPYLAGFEVDLEKILKHASSQIQITTGRRNTKDVTVTTDKTYDQVLKQLKEDNPAAKITPGTVYQAAGQKTRNITFHITEIEE